MHQISVLEKPLKDIMDELTRVEEEIRSGVYGNVSVAAIEDYKSRLNERVELHIKAMAEKGK